MNLKYSLTENQYHAETRENWNGRCANTSQIVVRIGLEELSNYTSLQNGLKKCQSIVGFSKRSTRFKHNFASTLPESYKTRWKSELAMVTKVVGKVDDINKTIEICDKNEWVFVPSEVSQMVELTKTLEFNSETLKFTSREKANHNKGGPYTSTIGKRFTKSQHRACRYKCNNFETFE